MAWIATKKITPTHRLFLPGDPLPAWMQTPAMLRTLREVYGADCVRQVDAAAASAAPPPPDDPEEAEIARQREASWREWQEMLSRGDGDAGGAA